MPDIFLSSQLVFGDKSAADKLCSQFDAGTQSEVAEAVQLQTGSVEIDKLWITVDGVANDNGYVELELELDDWLEPQHFANWLSNFEPDIICVTVTDESGEDEKNYYLVDGKRSRASTALKRIEKAAPGYKVADLIDDGKVTKLRKWLDDGLNVHARAYKQPLIIMAAYDAYKYPEFIELLLEYGASPNAPGCSFQWEAGDGPAEYVSPLYAVCTLGCSGSDEYIKAVDRATRALLAAGADPEGGGPDADATPLLQAIFHRGYPQVEVLLEAGADPNGVFPEHPVTPMSAAVHMHLEAPEEETRRILCYLVKAGANPNVTDLNCNPLGDAFSVIPELKDWVI